MKNKYKNKHVVMFLFSFLLFLNGEGAKAESCIDFKGCAKVMHNLLGQDYQWTDQAGLNFGSSSPIEMSKENAELLFTSLLDQTGYARVPVGDGKNFRVVRAGSAKETEVPIVETSAEIEPKLPNTWDWVMMRYKVKAPEMARYMESSFRFHLPRESRMQADSNSGIIMVTATIPIVRQMYQVFKGADRPMSNSERNLWKAAEKKSQETEKKTANKTNE